MNMCREHRFHYGCLKSRSGGARRIGMEALWHLSSTGSRWGVGRRESVGLWPCVPPVGGAPCHTQDDSGIWGYVFFNKPAVHLDFSRNDCVSTVSEYQLLSTNCYVRPSSVRGLPKRFPRGIMTRGTFPPPADQSTQNSYLRQCQLCIQQMLMRSV